MNILFHVLVEPVFFVLGIYLFFYLPGKFFFSLLKIQSDELTNFVLYNTIGLLLFTCIAYILSWLHIQILIFPAFIILDIFAVKKSCWFEPIILPKNEKLPVIIVLVLSLLFSISVVVTGIYGNTIAYRSDDIAHLAYIHEMQAHFPPQHPGFAGVPLQGYHFFFDFVIAQFSTSSFVTPETLYFHFFPIFLAIFWGFGIYVLLKAWTKKISAGLWGALFSLFGGSFGFIIRLQGHPKISLDDAFGINQPASALLNPPFSSSVVLLITALIILYFYLETKKKSWLIPFVLCAGFISMFKVYAGMILLGGFLVLDLLQMAQKKFVIIFALLATGILFFLTFGIFVGKGQHLIYFPLWEIDRTLTNNFPWYGYEEKMYTFSRLHVLHGIIETQIHGLNYYFLGNLGTRLIGMVIALIVFIKHRKKPSSFALVLSAMILISVLIPLFFIQTGKVFEIIQLAWYYPILCSLPAAIGLGYVSDLKFNKVFKAILIVILVVCTLPSAYENILSHISPFFYEKNERIHLSSPYFQTMRYLKSYGNYDATVLEIPPKEAMTNIHEWYMHSSPHIAAFANKRSYINYEFLPFTNIHENDRLKLPQKILQLETGNQNDISLRNIIKGDLLLHSIAFIYSTYPLQSFESDPAIKKLYTNSGYTIYKVNVSGATK